MSSVTTSHASRLTLDADAAWHERSARLFEELRRPASAMVRRAFGSAFADDEIEDIYANAWVGTLRALERRHSGLDDEEIRKYVLTAVAHQASKETRRRRRKPVSPMEKAIAVADDALLPDERADRAEQSAITRDLLASLPKRRRAVLMLRYGWGLEPTQVCELIEGLSPRAYRKEITKGIDQLTERIRTLESGAWCADREPILKAFAAGVADSEQQRQAQHHLAHCRHCAAFVGKLSGHLHDLGSSFVAPGVMDLVADGRFSLPDRVVEIADRARESVIGVFSRGASTASEASTSTLPSSAPRGAGAAGAGVLAKVAGLGAVGKATLACLSGGAAAAVCVATGVGPPSLVGEERPSLDADRQVEARFDPRDSLKRVSLAQHGVTEEPGSPADDTPSEPPPEGPPEEEPPPATEPPPPPPPPPPAAQQFDLAPAPAPAASGTGSGAGGDTRAEAAAGEFGP